MHGIWILVLGFCLDYSWISGVLIYVLSLHFHVCDVLFYAPEALMGSIPMSVVLWKPLKFDYSIIRMVNSYPGSKTANQ